MSSSGGKRLASSSGNKLDLNSNGVRPRRRVGEFDARAEVAAGQVLHHNVNAARRLEGLEETDHERVV